MLGSDTKNTFIIIQINLFQVDAVRMHFLFIRESWKNISLLIIVRNVSWAPNQQLEWFLKNLAALKAGVMAAKNQLWNQNNN